MDQQFLINSLPPHLRDFVAFQEYDHYSPRDHAVWRFTLQQLSRHLHDVAHPVYFDGLKRTGITLEHIPSIDDMNAALADIDWQAVVVDGFIPPAIFMEFQARRILPIALAMRSIDHILYTPAPDIVHEAAGHAPFLVDTDYGEFLQRFGEIGMRAIANEQDEAVYRAIRELSIAKENPLSSESEIAVAEANFQKALDNNSEPSETSLLARLHWWTVEYGLVGDVDNYRLFGAGLLSSLGESVHCLNDRQVEKLPLTVDVIRSGYDITRQQPQLFVTQSCKHLTQVLETFARSMCFIRGGAASLQYAIDAGTVNTAEFDTGIQLSGKLALCELDAVGNITYLASDGPSQLSYSGTELPGHGVYHHPFGLGSPLGMLKSFSRCLSQYSIDELRVHGIEMHKPVTLEFVSGVRVSGLLKRIVRRAQKNILFSFDDCLVLGADGTFLFRPELGRYHMAIGAEIVSVFGGPADRDTFPCYRHDKNTRATGDRQTAGDIVTRQQDPLMRAYAAVRELRECGHYTVPAIESIYRAQKCDFPNEWLLLVELRELCINICDGPGLACGLLARIDIDLNALKQHSEELRRLIDYAQQDVASAA